MKKQIEGGWQTLGLRSGRVKFETFPKGNITGADGYMGFIWKKKRPSAA